MFNLDAMANLFPVVGNNYALSIDGAEPILIHDGPRKMYILRNMSEDANIFIGFNDQVTAETGMPILPGEVMYFNTAADLYAISDYIGVSASSAVIKPNLRVVVLA